MTDSINIKEVPLKEALDVHKKIPEFKGTTYVVDNYEKRCKGREVLILVAYHDKSPAGYLIGYADQTLFIAGWEE